MRSYGKLRYTVCLLLALAAAGSSAAGVNARAATDAAAESPVLNVLLVGKDTDGEAQAARSDSLILCSFHCETGKLTMVSFLRDLYVPIPGHGKDRINAAYAYGGLSLLRQTVETNFGIEIDGCVEVNFSDFCGIIDCLGGVELELRQDEAAAINEKTGSQLSEGRNRLNGEQALAFARIRNLDPDGDFSRSRRQRTVLQAVYSAYKHTSLPALIRTMGSVLPMIRTDMKSGQLLSAAVRVFPHLSDLDVQSRTVPLPGQCEDRVINGKAVLVADLKKAGEQLDIWLSAPQAE